MFSKKKRNVCLQQIPSKCHSEKFQLYNNKWEGWQFKVDFNASNRIMI